MKMLLLISVSIIWLFFGCSEKKDSKPLIFSVMGDVPRSASEDTLLQRQIEAHNKYSPSEFMLHVGDIKSGGAPCDEEVYQRVSGFLKQLKVPTFIVPGDNEWNDCPDPAAAWTLWTKYLMTINENWPYDPKIERQKDASENIAWVSKNVLMIGINLVGGRIHDQSEWDRMMSKAAEWIEYQLKNKSESVKASVIFTQANPKKKHQPFMDKFLQSVKTFQKPVLFLHGDGHRWLYDNPWQLPNLVRVQVDQGRIALPLEVTVNVESDSTFHFKRKPFPFAYEMK